MRAANRNSLLIWGLAAGTVGALVFWHRSAQLDLGSTDFATGYLLLGLMVFLALYNTRKKLSMIPLGRASSWLTLHVIGGLAAAVVFAVHAGTIWPLGLTEQILASLFILVSVSGLLGYFLQLWLPGRLARRGPELIYDRMAAELARIRGEAEVAAMAAADVSGYDTLGRYYIETLAWYFARPRFSVNHLLGGRRPEVWLRRRLATIDRLLSDGERVHLNRLEELGAAKTALDAQYSLQTLLKSWTLIHVPLATMLLAFAIWHLIVVHVYAR